MTKMDTVKATITIGDTSIQLEGPQEFVEKYLERYYSVVEKLPISTNVGASITPQDKIKETGTPRKRTRSATAKGTPSCASRIRTLISENYFTEPRGVSDIVSWLKDQKGTTYQINQVGASLTTLIRSKELRRVKEEGKAYKYVNP